MNDDTIKRLDVIKELRCEYPARPMFKSLREEWAIKTEGFRKAEEIIMRLPSADRPQGEWVEVTIVEAWDDRRKEYYPVNKKGFRCNNCGNLAPHGRKWKSCPYCEARMKGAENEDN